jgi:hypothetical protein
MSKSQTNGPNNTQQSTRRPQHTKAGRTLLVKPSNTSSNVVFDAEFLSTFSGFQTTHHTEKTNSYFTTYATPNDALAALKGIKTKYGRDVRVKYSHYRIFFKLEGLTDETDYNTVKAAHTEFAQKLGCNVLYYRLYRKEKTYLGCGDMTIDVKDAFDTLLDSDKLKTFELSVGDVKYTGTHYRYKKVQNEDGNQKDTAEVAGSSM